MATYYIATTGNDTTGNGSESTPWATFAKFLSSSASGDTCIIAAGTYTWATATVANRTVQAATGAAVIFDGAGAIVKWTMSGTVTVTEITFEDAYANNDVNRSAIFTYGAATTATFTRCIFTDCVLRPISSLGGLFGNSGTADVGGNVAATFVSCTFKALTCDTGYSQWLVGCRMTASVARTFTYTFTSCVLYFATTSPLPLNLLFSKQNDANVTMTVTVKNTIIVNALGSTLTWGSGTFTSDCTYSDLVALTSAPSGTGNITSDPLFVDAAGGVFDLRPTSPCLGSGTLV